MNNLYKLKDFQFTYPYGNSSINWAGSYEINSGDIMLIGGESGAGKSTLLHALKGFIPETIFGKMSGTVLFKGKDLCHLSSVQRAKIGYLFQNPASQMIHKTVRQELAFGMENLNIKPQVIRQKIAEFSEQFEIEELLDRNIAELSGGEKQKTALLAILLMDPDILLFDEPTAFLDPSSAKHFVGLFHKIAKDKTIITVEHNLDYLKEHINRSIFIKKNGDISEQSVSNIIWEPSFEKIKKITPGKKVLEIKNLSFGYKQPLLKDINLDLREGEIVSIIGDNGAGKTTLLKLIGGIIKKYSGQIKYENNEIRQIHYKKYYQDLTMLMQNPENHFIFNEVIQEVNHQTDILQLINLHGYQKRNPFTLSEGEKRRLSLAILWSLERKIFLLDEPTFGQDAKNKENLINLICQMRQQGKSFLIISHDLPFIKAISDRTLMLKNGYLENVSGVLNA